MKVPITTHTDTHTHTDTPFSPLHRIKPTPPQALQLHAVQEVTYGGGARQCLLERGHALELCKRPHARRVGCELVEEEERGVLHGLAVTLNKRHHLVEMAHGRDLRVWGGGV